MRANLKWVLLLAGLTILFYWKLLLTSQYSLLTGGEAVNQAYSWLTFEVRLLRQATVPVWDATSFAGHPFAGEMQTALFYPLHWLLAFMPFDREGLLHPRLYHWMFVADHFLAALFFFLLLREMRFDRYVSFLGGICFSLGGFLSRVEWPHMLESALWTPLIALFLLRLDRSQSTLQRVAEGALASGALGMSILAGGLHVVFMQVILIATGVAFVKGREHPDQVSVKRRWTHAAIVGGAVILGGLACGAVQLWASHEYAARSIRFLGDGAMRADRKIPYELLKDQLFPQGIVSALFPSGLDGKQGTGEVWPPYIGALPFAFAVVGLWRRWSDPSVRYCAGLAVVPAVYSFASFSGLHGVAYSLVPFLWMAREATRFLFLTQFALCILMAAGLQCLRSDIWVEHQWSILRRVTKWVAIGCGLGLAIPTVFSRVDLSPWTGLSLVWLSITSLWLTASHSRMMRQNIWVAAAAFVFLDLLSFNWIGRSKDADRANPGGYQTTLESARGAAEFLKGRVGPFRVEIPGGNPPNIGNAFGIPTVQGAGVTRLESYDKLLGNPDLLNARYKMLPRSAQDCSELYHDEKWKVCESPGAFPRAWMVHEVSEPKGPIPFDLHKTAVLDRGQQTLRMKPTVAGDDAEIRWKLFDGEHIEVSAHPKSSGLLVFSELAYPGWRASVNGASAEIYSVDGGLRAVMIPAAQTTVSMEYRPISVRLGASLSIAAFIGVALLNVLSRLRKRPEQVR